MEHIKKGAGDIWKTKAQTIIIPVTANGTFNSAVAKQALHKYRWLQDYFDQRLREGFNAGDIFTVKIPAPNSTSAYSKQLCFFIVRDKENKSNMKFITDCMSAFINNHYSLKITSAAFPKLFLQSQGSWESDVKKKVTTDLERVRIPIQIYG